MMLVDTSIAAAELGAKPDHIRHLAREGKLPCYRLGGKYLFDLDEVLKAIRHERRDDQTQEAGIRSIDG